MNQYTQKVLVIISDLIWVPVILFLIKKLLIMYLSKLIRLFRIKEPFLTQQEIDQEQEALIQAQQKINCAMEIFKSVLEFLLGYRLLPNLYAIIFFLLSLSSLSSIILIHQKIKINSLCRVFHSLLFSALYLYKFQTSDFLIIYLIYVSQAIELDAMKVFYYVGFQVIYETLKPESFILNNGEQIFSWLILCTIYLNLFVTNKKKLSLTFPQFSMAKDADIYDEHLFDINEKQYLIILNARNHEILYVNKPFLKKFGTQTSILEKLEQFIVQTDHEYNNDGNKSTDHYFTKSTNILESLNHQDLYLSMPFITQAQLEDQTYKVNMQQCTWKGQQCYAISIINITDDQMVLELKKLDSYKDNILATVSHDLKNPIGAIYQTLLFVQDDLQKQTKQQQDLNQSAQFIDICINCVLFLQSFVNDLSDFQMIKLQKLKILITEFDTLYTFKQIQQVFQPQLQVKQIEFHIQNKAENTLIKNDEVRLKQVLFNLISNSSKFTNNGQISLKMSDNNQDIQEFYLNVKNQMKQNKSNQSLNQLDQQLNNLLLITVSDTGVGISDEVKGQLFKSYSTFDGEKKQNRNGVGLGLMISKQLCGYIGPLKYIYINSRIGVGTNFQFVIYKTHYDNIENVDDQPIQINQVRCQKMPKQTPQNKQRSVLLVDDELFNNATHKELFQQCGVNQIQMAYCASDAIQLVKQKQFDMILLDINLPDKSGILCIKDFKKFNRNAKIYILSAFDDQETRQQCIKEGADPSKYQIENRDYNIITCVDFHPSQQSLPPLRKLGQSQDHPFPRKAKFEIAQEQIQMQQTQHTRDHNSQQEIRTVKPASMMNVSSVKFDFISFTQAKSQPFNDLKQEMKIIHKKKGGMGEIADLGGLCYPNFNKEYQDKIKENQTVFRKQKGEYPAVTEPKFTYGPFMKPFKKYKF